MTTGLNTLQLPAPSPSCDLEMDFDRELRLLEDRIAERLHGRGTVGRFRRTAHRLGAAYHRLTAPVA